MESCSVNAQRAALGLPSVHSVAGPASKAYLLLQVWDD